MKNYEFKKHVLSGQNQILIIKVIRTVQDNNVKAL